MLYHHIADDLVVIVQLEVKVKEPDLAEFFLMQRMIFALTSPTLQVPLSHVLPLSLLSHEIADHVRPPPPSPSQ